MNAHRQGYAIVALLLIGGSIVLAAVVAVQAFPHGVAVLACLLLGVACLWSGLIRRGFERALALTAAALLLIGAVVLVVLGGHVLEDTLVVVAFLVGLAAARRVFVVRVHLPPAGPLAHPVLFYNPKSGGGKAERFKVAEQARARGVDPIELRAGDDLASIVRAAISDGADALGMAGGDGSQAVVAAIAAEHRLPYICIPAGTRNHFALDLGVDRNDVVGALDAFVHGGERLIDLAEVNSRVFVNNVSLGVYAEAVQNSSYRDAKLRTILDTVPTVLGPQSTPLGLNWVGPDGRRNETSAVVLVSNDPYRLGRAIGSGTRPRLDTGQLGITVIGSREDGRERGRRIEEWAADSFEVQSERQVAAGIDGEAVLLDPPLRFRTRPQALRVLIAPQHPGASPSARMPPGVWGGAPGTRSRGHLRLMVSLPGRDWLRGEHEDVAGQPQFRYPAVLALMFIAVVFLIAAPTANWTLAVAIAIEGLAMVITVATSRERESVRRRRALVLGLAMFVAVLLVAVGLAPRWLTALIALAVTAGVPIVLIRGLLRLLQVSGVTFNAVAGSLAIYLSTGLLFAWIVGFVAQISSTPYFAQHATSSQGEKVYFSFTVLTTTGFGDFTPASATGHALAVIEMLIGQIYLVTVIGLLIGNFAARGRPPEP